MFSASGPKMHFNCAGQPPQAPSCVQTHTLAPDLAWDTAGMGPALSSGDAHLPIRGLGLALVTWLITLPSSDDQQKLLLSLFPLCLSQAATLPAEAGVTVDLRTVLPWILLPLRVSILHLRRVFGKTLYSQEEKYHIKGNAHFRECNRNSMWKGIIEPSFPQRF